MLRAARRTSHPGVLSLGAVLLAVACVVGAFVGAATGDLPLVEAAPMLVIGLLFVVAGVVASSRRPDNVSGRLLSMTGLAWLLRWR